LDKPKHERSLLAFAAEVAGPELWGRYYAVVCDYYADLDGTPMAMEGAAEAVRERWAGLRTNPQSFIYGPLLRQIEQFEADIDARTREALQSGQYVATGFVGIDEQPVPARIFRDVKVRIWLGQSEIELPNGTVIQGAVINPAAPTADAPAGSGRQIGKPQSVKPGAPKVHIPTKTEVLQKWIAERYPQGIPAGTTNKHLAREFSNATKNTVTVNERTVRRARGGK
jgi:hypothetical protein